MTTFERHTGAGNGEGWMVGREEGNAARHENGWAVEPLVWRLDQWRPRPSRHAATTARSLTRAETFARTHGPLSTL
ncbi:hypothetical protein E2C01_023640 [Portunus trituberculatus]|uniref:Uncharacterized protein n=1 Tax=Portunus trituberculatus TaxID=210409 RepID=A0A5B7EAI8_PORTR|nr:hypothetical protein [Portunus trituberculatus]